MAQKCNLPSPSEPGTPWCFPVGCVVIGPWLLCREGRTLGTRLPTDCSLATELGELGWSSFPILVVAQSLQGLGGTGALFQPCYGPCVVCGGRSLLGALGLLVAACFLVGLMGLQAFAWPC